MLFLTLKSGVTLRRPAHLIEVHEGQYRNMHLTVDKHSSQAISIIIEGKLIQSRQCGHDFHEIIFPARVKPLHTTAHAAPLEFIPRIPRARGDAVVDSLKYACTNRQINFFALVAALNVDGQRLHVTRHG